MTPEPLYMKLARSEKKLAKEQGREAEGWMCTKEMDKPRNIDFEAIEDEQERSDEQPQNDSTSNGHE